MGKNRRDGIKTEEEMLLRVVTPEGTVLETKAVSVKLPTEFGSLGLLTGRAPMLCPVEKGIVRFRSADGTEGRIFTGGGMVSTTESEVTVLVSRKR